MTRYLQKAERNGVLMSAQGRAGIFLMAWMICAFEMVLRRPDMILNPQLWAEDGSVFVSEALFAGWRSLWVPYAGYPQLIIRLITLTSVFVSQHVGHGIDSVPFLMNAAAIAIDAASIAFICAPRFDWLGALPWRLTIAVLVVAIPPGSEIFGTMTNVGWWLGLSQLLCSWDMLARKRLPPAWLSALLVLASFSGPLGALPAVAGVALLASRVIPGGIRSLRLAELVRVAVLWPGVAAIPLLTLSTRAAQSVAHSSWEAPVYLLRYLLVGIFAQTVIPDFVPTVNSLGYTVTGLIGAAIAGCLIWFHREHLWAVTALLSSILFVLGMTFVGSSSWFYSFTLPYNVGAGRYFFLPMAVLVTGLVLGASRVMHERGIRVMVAGALLGLVVVTDANNFELQPFADWHWRSAVQFYESQGDRVCGAIINPGWQMNYPCRIDIREASDQAMIGVLRQTNEQGLEVSSSVSIDALKRLLEIYTRRPDLWAAYGKTGRLNLSQLLVWASVPGGTVDSDAWKLAPYADSLRALASQANHLGSVYVDEALLVYK